MSQENLPILRAKPLRMSHRDPQLTDDPTITSSASDTLPAPMSEPPSMPVEFEEWSALYQNFRMLGPTARKVLMMTAERLAMGRRQYNDDFDNPRDWTDESLAESIDLNVYLLVRLIKDKQAGR